MNARLPSASQGVFVVQKHMAGRLHYDFRLEIGGVLKSWALPKGPTVDSAITRLAVPTDDHPLEFGEFEGVIRSGEYGGGTVMIWDRGTFSALSGDAAEEFRVKELHFRLHGRKLSGEWLLIKARHGNQWFLKKLRDEHSSSADVLQEHPFSAVSCRTLREIAEDEGGDPERAEKGDPRVLPDRPSPKRRAEGEAPDVWTGCSV